jgi:hypothetical protein
LQASDTVQSLPSSQGVPAAACFTSQVALAPTVPEQASGASQAPLSAGPQAVPGGFAESAGHAGEVPVQVSSSSHDLAAARHTVVAGRFTHVPVVLQAWQSVVIPSPHAESQQTLSTQ